MPGTGDRVHFLVVGTPRSGTTVVQRLALGLAGVAMPPETHFFTDLAPGMMRRHPAPLDAAAARAEAEEFLRLPSSAGMRLDPLSVALRVSTTPGTIIDLFDALVAELAGPAALLGEKTPDHLLWWRPIARARPDMRFVVVVRHPLDVIASNLAAPFRAVAARRWGDDYFLALAEHWVHHQRLALDLVRDRGPSLATLLRYEDVVADPGAATTKLAALLERPVGAAQPQGSGVVLEWEHWKKASFGEILASSVGSWSQRLADDQVRRATPAIARLAHELGYEVPATRASWRGTKRESRTLRRRLTHLEAGLRSQQATIDGFDLS